MFWNFADKGFSDGKSASGERYLPSIRIHGHVVAPDLHNPCIQGRGKKTPTFGAKKTLKLKLPRSKGRHQRVANVWPDEEVHSQKDVSLMAVFCPLQHHADRGEVHSLQSTPSSRGVFRTERSGPRGAQRGVIYTRVATCKRWSGRVNRLLPGISPT